MCRRVIRARFIFAEFIYLCIHFLRYFLRAHAALNRNDEFSIFSPNKSRSFRLPFTCRWNRVQTLRGKFTRETRVLHANNRPYFISRIFAVFRNTHTRESSKKKTQILARFYYFSFIFATEASGPDLCGAVARCYRKSYIIPIRCSYLF